MREDGVALVYISVRAKKASCAFAEGPAVLLIVLRPETRVVRLIGR